MIRFCKACGGEELQPLWEDGEAPWLRCLACGSDSAARTYADVGHLYSADYIQAALDREGGLDNAVAAMRSNLDWFQDYRGKAPNNSFLDVGCCEGAALAGMQDRGWAVHGFDVIRPPYDGPHVTVAPHFSAALFPQQYAAVLCREVIEHVEGWRDLLTECHAATARDGLFQLQTPRPWHLQHPIPYQRYHLQLLSPAIVRYWLERLGFIVLDFRLWDMGQGWLCQKVG